MGSKLNLFAWYDRLSVRERRVCLAASGCLLLLLVDMTVFTPVWDSYVSLTERIVSKEGVLVRNLINLQRKETVESEYEKYRAFVRQAGSDQEENASLLSEVEQLARSNQVVLVDMKPRDAKSSEFHKEYIAELDAEAEMKNLVEFIHQMEESAQVMKVSNVKLAAKDAKGTIVKARITVTKTAFLGGS